MTSRRLRAPSADGGVLTLPGMAGAHALLATNRSRLDGWRHDFQGRDAERLRAMARGEVLGRARSFLADMGLTPADEGAGTGLVVTGHQPELFHPGVWVKNFAIAGAARAAGGTALNLIVDNDLPKAAGVRVPTVVGDALRTRWVEFDAWNDEVPFEDGRVRDERLFESFGRRALADLAGAVEDPLLADDWGHAAAAATVTDRPGLRFAAMRRTREATWGVRNLELPLGSLCETDAFLWFACHLLAQLPRFRDVHNEALAAYRQLHGIRSRNHPVADLREDAGWIEAPFWAWRAERPRRKPLMVRQVDPRTLAIRLAGEADPLMDLPLGPDRDACCAVERLRELPGLGVRLRTRALTTTMFARLLLGDLFLHGIGGAKYDELGDEIIRRFFQFEPPAFWTLSLTAHLGIPTTPATPGRLAQLGRRIRDLTFNPDRVLDDLPPELLEAKRLALLGPVSTHRQRVGRYHEIRRANDAFRPLVEGPLRQAIEVRDRLAAGLGWNRVARSREFAAVLHSRSRLADLLRPWAAAPAAVPDAQAP